MSCIVCRHVLMKYLLLGLTDDNAAFRHSVDAQGNITADAAPQDTSEEKTDKADNNDHDTDSEMTTSEDTTTGNGIGTQNGFNGSRKVFFLGLNSPLSPVPDTN